MTPNIDEITSERRAAKAVRKRLRDTNRLEPGIGVFLGIIGQRLIGWPRFVEFFGGWYPMKSTGYAYRSYRNGAFLAKSVGIKILG